MASLRAPSLCRSLAPQVPRRSALVASLARVLLDGQAAVSYGAVHRACALHQAPGQAKTEAELAGHRICLTQYQRSPTRSGRATP